MHVHFLAREVFVRRMKDPKCFYRYEPGKIYIVAEWDRKFPCI